MTNEMKIVSQLVERVREQLTFTEQDLEDFQEEFTKDPVAALGRAENAYDDAVRARLYKDFLASFEEGGTLADIRDYRDNYLHRAVMAHVKSSSRSTSACADLIDEAGVRECARFIDFMKGCGV